MKKPTLFLALMASSLACLPHLSGQVALDGPWYTGSIAGTPTLSDTNSDTFSWGSGAADSGTIRTGVLWTHFPAQTLANNGDSIEVRFTIEFSGVTPNDNPTGVRLGLFDSNGTTPASNLSGTNGDPAFKGWSGYQLFLDGAGTNDPGSELRYTKTGNNAPLGGGPTSRFGTVGSANYALDTPHEFSLTITRNTVNEYAIRVSGFGISGSVQTTHMTASSFDSFMIQATGAVPKASVFNFTGVAVIP